MGVIYDYFAAPSDESAAATLDWAGGPGQPTDVPPVKARTRWFRRRTEEAPPQAHAYPTVPGNGIDPVVQLGTLVSLLDSVSYEDAVGGDQSAHQIAERDGGTLFVIRLNPNVAASLAAASDVRIAEVAVPWSQTEEFWGDGDPDALTGLVRELAQLSKDALESGSHLYCWVAV